MLSLDTESWRSSQPYDSVSRTYKPKIDPQHRKIVWYAISGLVVSFGLLGVFLFLYRFFRKGAALTLTHEFYLPNNEFIRHRPIYWQNIVRIEEIKQTIHVPRLLFPIRNRAIRIIYKQCQFYKKGTGIYEELSARRNNQTPEKEQLLSSILIPLNRQQLLEIMRRYWLTALGEDPSKIPIPTIVEEVISRKETRKQTRKFFKRLFFGKE